MGGVVKTTKAKKVVIDHHVSQDDLGAELFKNTEAEATGRLVVEAADALGVQLTPEIAEPAFVALATDTGWFRFASAKAGTLQLAARLIDAGAVPHRIYGNLYETDTHARLQLIGEAFSHTRTELGGRLIYTWLTQADFTTTVALPSDSEDVINMTLAVGGTQVAVIFVEQPTGGFKVSLRSRCEVDCRAIAELFGGGGHKAAAGAFLNEPLELAREKMLEAVRKAMRASRDASGANGSGDAARARSAVDGC
jgi:bifunctional oligoribonuclease and PAP phosphatase NrnA